MDITFISIHDLTPECNILYSSDSIVDILGHTPDEVVGKSAWEFFRPEELSIAKERHERGIKLDKAAVLHYCPIKDRQGNYVLCECCFTVVYNVIVVCTSIYRRGMTSQKRAVEAPIVRKLFTSSPKDPRYHMLSHLSSKFSLAEEEQTHEPRAALFLNRFTKTLTIMYATSGIEKIIGISNDDMIGRSLYYCIEENCMDAAIKSLEGAKGNDSIAYLRFFFRDPRQDDDHDQYTTDEDTDASMTDVTTSDDEGGRHAETTSGDDMTSRDQSGSGSLGTTRSQPSGAERTTTSGDSTTPAFTGPTATSGSTSSHPTSPTSTTDGARQGIELEAVVSCASDGLVLILRRARPLIPTIQHPQHQPAAYGNPIFAAPWAPEPVFFPPRPAAPYFGADMNRPYPQAQQQQQQAVRTAGGPPIEAFMQSIRDVAVFAWALVGINGSLEDYALGRPGGESQPPEGLPVWNPERHDSGAGVGGGFGDGNLGGGFKNPFGDPGLGGRDGNRVV